MGNLDVVIAEYPAGEPGSGPYGLTAGPDDAVWFTRVHRGRIGRMSPSGETRPTSLVRLRGALARHGGS